MARPGLETDFQRETRLLVRDLKSRAKILIGLVALLWFIEIVNLLLGNRLLLLGIHPRSLWGLIGVFLWPFLHAGILHLAANTIPLVILGWLVMLDRIRDFVVVSVTTAVLGGLGVWLIAPANTVHIGASGVIFGYLGFLLLRGYFQRSVAWLMLSLVVGLSYGGVLLWSMVPVPGVSWQGHLCGFLAGVFAARGYRRKSN